MLEFQGPKPTKSGEPVLEIWNELKENWGVYKCAKLEDDYATTRKAAVKIKELQEDLGMEQTQFPELKEK